MGRLATSASTRMVKFIYPEPNTGCWIWSGQLDVNGYGRIHSNGKARMAHRIVYEFYKGTIPDSLCLDHLCRNPFCVNPDHLEPVTIMENLMRSPIINANRTHCRKGHEYTEENTYVHFRKNGTIMRTCMICSAKNKLAYYHRSNYNIRRKELRKLKNLS